MRMMVQHRFNWQRHLTGPLAGNVARMRVADDTLRGKIINVLDQMQRIAPLMLNAVIAQIAQMLTNHRLFPPDQTESIFQISA
ncbi:hypothetical protein D3C73_1377450 [compost metagenome]